MEQKKIERIPFRVKDFLTVLGSKDMSMTLCNATTGEQYDPEKNSVDEYMNLYVINIEFDAAENTVHLFGSDSIEIFYLPNIPISDNE